MTRMQGRSRAAGALVAVVMTITSMVAISAAPVAAATAPCKVLNTRTGALGSSLTTAITKAKATDTLKVTGTCTGAFTIGKSLSIVKGTKAATLKGNGLAPVVTITAGKVKLTGLRITGGEGSSCPVNGGHCGGGVFAVGDGIVATLTKVTIAGNTATAGDANFAGGAGLVVGGGVTMKLIRSTVTGNTVTANQAYGGGILDLGTLTLTRSTVSKNILDAGDEAQGGGIASVLDGTRLTIVASTIAGNQANGPRVAFGGGVVAMNEPVTIRRSTISGNVAGGTGGNGGGLYAYEAATITDSTISGNTASQQGGGAGIGGAVLLRGVTVARNAAPSNGGVMIGGAATVFGSILAENQSTADSSGSVDCSVSNLAMTYSLVGNGKFCGSVEDGTDFNRVGSLGSEVDPLLGNLAKNGGPTKTHALQAASPAIDHGGSTDCTKTDQRGIARPKGTACDLGAFEVVPG